MNSWIEYLCHRPYVVFQGPKHWIRPLWHSCQSPNRISPNVAVAANATNVPLAREEEGASWWSEMRIDEHMPPFRGSGRLKEWISCKCWVRSVLSSRPLYHTHSLAHSQRSKNGQSPGWKSCRVGLGKDSRYARSNGGFERCVYKYTRIHVSPYNPSMVREHGQQCGMPTVPGNPCRHLLQHPQLCLSSRPAHCCPPWSASQTEVCCAFLKPALVEQFLCFTWGRGMDANCCPLGKNLVGMWNWLRGRGESKDVRCSTGAHTCLNSQITRSTGL